MTPSITCGTVESFRSRDFFFSKAALHLFFSCQFLSYCLFILFSTLELSSPEYKKLKRRKICRLIPLGDVLFFIFLPDSFHLFFTFSLSPLRRATLHLLNSRHCNLGLNKDDVNYSAQLLKSVAVTRYKSYERSFSGRLFLLPLFPLFFSLSF